MLKIFNFEFLLKWKEISLDNDVDTGLLQTTLLDVRSILSSAIVSRMLYPAMRTTVQYSGLLGPAMRTTVPYSGDAVPDNAHSSAV